VTALAKAIAASSPPDLDHADPLPVPTTGGSPGGSSTALISTKPGSAAASQPLNQTLANGLANQNMVPQTNPNSVPQTIQNSVPQTSNTLAHQANPIRQSKCWKSIQKSTKNFQKRSKFSRQKVGKFRQNLMSKNAIRIVLGRSRKKFSHKNKISNKIPKKEKSHHLSRMEIAASAQHQSIEGQGLSMPIQNAILWSNSEPQNKFINTYHYILDNSLYYRVNNSKQSCNDTNNANFLAEQKSTKNFQKRSKFSRQKFGKFQQILMSKNVIRMVLGRSRKKFCHKNIISNKIPNKLLKH
jgi:hypothetical protein